MKYSFLTIIFIFFSSILPAQETITVAYFNNYPPFSWEEEGNMKGIFIDILNEALTENMGISVSHKGFPWARAQKFVEDGKIDAFLTVPTPERKKYTEVSKEIIVKSKVSLFVPSGHSKTEEIKNIKTLEELKHFKMITYLGDGVAKNLFHDWKNIYYTNTLDKCLFVLKNGRSDLFLQSSELTNYRIIQLGYQNDIIELPAPMEPVSYHFMIGKKSSFINILPEFDQVIRKMREDEIIEKIYNKHIR